MVQKSKFSIYECRKELPKNLSDRSYGEIILIFEMQNFFYPSTITSET